MADAAVMKSGDVVLTMTAFEAEALMSLMTYGREYVSENLEGRIASAGKRVTDALSEVSRMADKQKSERSKKRTWMDI